MKTLFKYLANGNFVWVFSFLIVIILAVLYIAADFMNYHIYGAYMFEYPGLFFVYFIALIVVMILVFVLILYESIKAKHIVLPCNDSPGEFKLLVLSSDNTDEYLLLDKPYWVRKGERKKEDHIIKIPEEYINAAKNGNVILQVGQFKLNSSSTEVLLQISFATKLKDEFSPKNLYEVMVNGESKIKDVGKFIETNYEEMISKNSGKANELFHEFENNNISSIKFLNGVLDLIKPEMLFSNFRSIDVSLEMMEKTRKICK